MENIPSINIVEYDYPLPDDKIAKYPLPVRDRSKLLVCNDGEITDHFFSHFPGLIQPRTLLILNDTRVIHARLNFQKDSGAKIEVFCLEPESPVRDIQLAMQQTESCTWKCLVGNAKKWKGGNLLLEVRSNTISCLLTAELLARSNDSFYVRFSWTPGHYSYSQIIETSGNVPLPPYIHRPAEKTDNVRYQTVYASNDGSVAAPTAGLHFTQNIFHELKQRGIETTYTTLHVGAGTFRPVQTNDIEQHIMHPEQVIINKKLLEDLIGAKGEIIAVGTTTIRSVESLYYVAAKLQTQGILSDTIGQWEPYDNQLNSFDSKLILKNLLNYMERNQMEQLSFHTHIIIIPGYRFKIIQGMVTNFHQPRSTLLLLVSAFLGEDWKRVYTHALQNNYRFLSYGDACLFMKKPDTSFVSAVNTGQKA